MITIQYNPATKVFTIIKNGIKIEAKLSISQVMYILHNYIVSKEATK